MMTRQQIHSLYQKINFLDFFLVNNRSANSLSQRSLRMATKDVMYRFAVDH